MADLPVPKSHRKRQWELTESALRKLLDWFDEGRNSEGQRYLEIRRRLVTYFECKKCPNADDLADETLGRVARRLEEEGAISSDTPARYCYIVAHFVFLESLKQPGARPLFEAQSATAASEVESEDSERRLECLKKCISKLGDPERALITAYYHGEQREKINNRKALASNLNISLNALIIRASRIRDKLETCIRKCMSGAA